MVAAMALFVVNDVLVKLATAHFPVGQLLAVRGAFSILAALAMVRLLGGLGDLRAMREPRVLLRGLLEGMVALTFITALARLPIANITAILQAASLIVVALAAALGIEQVGWRRWLAIGVGFIGVLLIVRPSVDGFNIYALVALVSAILVGCRDLLTRSIGASVPSSVVTLVTTCAVMLTGCVMGVFETWVTPFTPATFHLVAAAMFVAVGNYAIIVAYRSGDVSLVSGFRYTVLVFALIAGLVIWGERPDALSMFGSALIVGSGLYALHRQRVRARAAAAAGPR
jgi:drug/metabolite transporter (DMT)-like permease